MSSLELRNEDCRDLSSASVEFANFFFNLALRPELVPHSSDWGIDSAWCAAAKSWDSSRPGCHLIPVVAFQDDYKHSFAEKCEA